MHYVKDFDINGVVSRQVACIELHGKPNAATEGALGALGIDVDSPFREVYKCVAVNGSIYTWELLSSGLSTIASTISGKGAELVQFPYDTLKIPAGYLLKTGDLIIDSKGYLYQVSALDNTFCRAAYCGVAFLKGDKGDTGAAPYIGENGNWWINGVDTGVANGQVVTGSYVGTGKNSPYAVTLNFDFTPKFLLVYNLYKWEQEVDGLNYGYIDYVLAVFVNGAPFGVAHNYWWTGENNFDGWDIDASWGNKSVSFGSRYDADETYNPYDHYNLDNPNRTYYYVAIG